MYISTCICPGTPKLSPASDVHGLAFNGITGGSTGGGGLTGIGGFGGSTGTGGSTVVSGTYETPSIKIVGVCANAIIGNSRRNRYFISTPIFPVAVN
jgi:hypothetical protein